VEHDVPHLYHMFHAGKEWKMTVKQLEVMANNAEDMPGDLTPDERVLYISLLDLYARYRRGDINQEDASREKRVLMAEHNRAVMQRARDQFYTDWAIRILMGSVWLICEHNDNPDSGAADRLMEMLTGVLWAKEDVT